MSPWNRWEDSPYTNQKGPQDNGDGGAGSVTSAGGLVVDDPDFQLWQGDALEMLRGLPSGSVHCALTSPPFYGLRDYGTGSWEGGDDGCDHQIGSKFDGVAGHLRLDDSGLPSEADKRGLVEPLSDELLNGGETTEGLVLVFGSDVDDDTEIGAESGLLGSGHSHIVQHPVSNSKCRRCGARRVDNQIGLEASPDEWVARLVDVFREVRRVLRDDGTLWVEIGDSYNAYNGNRGPSSSISAVADARRNAPPRGLSDAGTKPKDLIGAPWLLAFALRADGWYLRSEIVWFRPNPMPESVTDRPTKSHSTVFLLAKQPRYFFDQEAVREPHSENSHHGLVMKRSSAMKQAAQTGTHGNGAAEISLSPAGRNVRSVWRIATQPTPFAHFATWPEKLVERMILAGTSERGCCPECGAPWERETETERLSPSGVGTQKKNAYHPLVGHTLGANGPTSRVTTTGWRPSCECGTQQGVIGQVGTVAHDPVPCTVLDPFMGSGTTALVARRLGRRSVGVELSPEYAELCARRLSQQSLFA